MKKNEIVSHIDAEKNQQNLAEARARLKQFRETYQLKRRAAQAELRILEIQRDRARNAMRHARRNSQKMAIRGPLDGVVVLNSIWKGGQMAEAQEGDEVRAGVPFMQVVNPAAMQVRVRVNQADIPYLRVGQPVQVRLDAYPEMVFAGKLEQIAAIGTTSGLSQKVRTFSATFSIAGNHPNLMPDLSAAVDVELERRAGSLVVPRDAVLSEEGHTYLRVHRGSGFEKRTVKIGPAGDHEVVIESGVEAGLKSLWNQRPGMLLGAAVVILGGVGPWRSAPCPLFRHRNPRGGSEAGRIRGLRATSRRGQGAQVGGAHCALERRRHPDCQAPAKRHAREEGRCGDPARRRQSPEDARPEAFRVEAGRSGNRADPRPNSAPAGAGPDRSPQSTVQP